MKCTDHEIRLICIDWYDGLNSAMHRAGMQKEFSPRTLLKEVRQAIDSLAFDGDRREFEEKRLRKVEKFAEREVEKAKVEKAVQKIAKRARQSGMSWERFSWLAKYQF